MAMWLVLAVVVVAVVVHANFRGCVSAHTRDQHNSYHRQLYSYIVWFGEMVETGDSRGSGGGGSNNKRTRCVFSCCCAAPLAEFKYTPAHTRARTVNTAARIIRMR